MHIGNFEFKPTVLTTVLALVLVTVFSYLGNWQLERAGEKRVLVAKYESWKQESPLQLDERVSDPRSLRYRRVTVTGQLDAEHQFLLDNQIHNGRAGYHVLTPMRINTGNSAVLVNRGWVPASGYRNVLPEIPVKQGAVTMEGVVTLPYRPAMSVDIKDNSGPWPRVVQQIEPDTFSEWAGYPLFPVVVLLDPMDENGYVREWKIVVTPPEKHQAYAMQWFSFALIILFLYVMLNTRRVPWSEVNK